MSSDAIGAVVLCGGQSRRMGFPKAWLSVGGEPLLPRTVHMLATVTSKVVISAAAGQTLPPLPDAVAIAHDALPNLGPLSGMAAAFDLLPDGMVFVAACDLPGLSAKTVQSILCALTPSCDAAVPLVAGRPQPLAAVYRRRLLPIMREQLTAGEFSMQAFLNRVRWQPIHHVPANEFRNLNAPSDLAELECEHPP